MKISIKLLITCLLLVAAGSPYLSAQEEMLEAQWQAYQVRFHFIGQSSAYTCDGIESTLSRLLKLLGARDDIRVEASCYSSNKPERILRVKLAFALPVLADKTDIAAEIIPAQWQEVKIIGTQSRYLGEGDCELLEQFQRQVLPLLQIRNLKNKIRCIPYRQNYNSSRAHYSVLKAMEKMELEVNRDEEDIDSSQTTK